MGNISSSPTVYNKTMTTASTEYSQELPAGTHKFLLKCRGSYAIRLCFIAEGTATLYITIPADRALLIDNLSLSGTRTLYLRCETAAQVAEILVWT